jgi:glycosyltransferase involved in cell wall biosynthesis
VQAGHRVTVISEIPNHPSGIIPPEYTGKLYEQADLDGIEVIRVWVKTSPVKNFRNRMGFYLSYMVMAILAGLFLARGKYDAIYATSPPLFVGAAALVLSYVRRLPLVFEVRDLWPESAVVLGELKNRWAVALAEWIEQACYQRAERIVIVTQGIFNRLLGRGYPVEKLALIPNGANANLFQFQPGAGQAVRQKLGLEDKFVVIYAGILGIAQGLEVVIECAKQLVSHFNLHFLFVGAGPVKQEMMALAKSYELPNVTFHSEVPREQMSAFLSAANVALVPLRQLDLFQSALPSKMFDAWACQCPTIITIDGEARQVLAKAQAGLYVEPENPEALAKAILQLKNDPVACQQMGVNGRQTVMEKYSRQMQAQQLTQLLVQVVQRQVAEYSKPI